MTFPATPAPRLAAHGLARQFDGRVAVTNLSIALEAGEVVALLGPNGAGKTTTLRMLAGLIAPSAGTIEIGGVRVDPSDRAPLRSRVGLLTETPGLWDRLTVEDNLLVYARLHELSDPRGVVADALARYGLTDRARDRAATLSKGMKQKVALARALLHDPEIALLDEPTAGLDPTMARSVRALVLDLKARGRTVLLSTHNLDEAERVADRIAVVRQTLVAVETPAALRRRLFGERVRIGLAGDAASFAEAARTAGAREVDTDGDTLVCRLTDPGHDIPELVRHLVAAGAAIRRVDDDRQPLEEVYARLLDHSDGEMPR